MRNGLGQRIQPFLLGQPADDAEQRSLVGRIEAEAGADFGAVGRLAGEAVGVIVAGQCRVGRRVPDVARRRPLWRGTRASQELGRVRAAGHAGGGAGRLTGGRHLRYAEGTPLANLFMALLTKLDVPVEQFGDSTGTLQHLNDV